MVIILRNNDVYAEVKRLIRSTVKDFNRFTCGERCRGRSLKSLHDLYSREVYLLDLLSEGRCNLRVGMAHNGGAPAAYIVHVLHKPSHISWASVQANLA